MKKTAESLVRVHTKKISLEKINILIKIAKLNL